MRSPSPSPVPFDGNNGFCHFLAGAFDFRLKAILFLFMLLFTNIWIDIPLKDLK